MMTPSTSMMANMQDDELALALEDAAAHSPVIAELVKRLTGREQYFGDMNHKVECPVCQAALEVDPDEANQLFNLKVEK